MRQARPSAAAPRAVPPSPLSSQPGASNAVARTQRLSWGTDSPTTSLSPPPSDYLWTLPPYTQPLGSLCQAGAAPALNKSRVRLGCSRQPEARRRQPPPLTVRFSLPGGGGAVVVTSMWAPRRKTGVNGRERSVDPPRAVGLSSHLVLACTVCAHATLHAAAAAGVPRSKFSAQVGSRCLRNLAQEIVQRERKASAPSRATAAS